MVDVSAGGWTSKIEALAGSTSGEASSWYPDSCPPLMAFSPCEGREGRKGPGVSSKDTNSCWMRAPSLRPLLNSITSFKALSPDTVPLGLWASAYGFGEDTVLSVTSRKESAFAFVLIRPNVVVSSDTKPLKLLK